MTKKPDITLPPHKPIYMISALSQSQGWHIKQNGVPDTWKITQGEGEIALVIDTGHPQHKDLNGNAIEGKNFVSGEDIYDHEGHQTHVTGIICAQNNSQGMVGVAPKGQCISAKALGSDGNGSFEALEAALNYAIRIKPTVVSMSLGAPIGSDGIHKAIRVLFNLNIPIICAAGNFGDRGVDFPARYDETISVAAYGPDGNVADFSAKGEQVDWTAPGVNIYSTYLDDKYCIMSGTSMATPFITGIILLLIAKHKKQERETGKNDCKTVEEIKQHLLKYTVDKGVIGKDHKYGYGVLDVKKMILIDSCGDSPLPKPEPKPEPEKPRKGFFCWLKNLFKKIF